MYWVIQDNMFNEDGFKRLIKALNRLELPYSLHKVIPFVGDLLPEPVIPEGMPVVVMGSYSMAHYAERKGWFPGSIGYGENFDYEQQAPHWGGHMLNSDSLVCRFADVPEQPIPFFIRPTLDSKSFCGTTTDWPTFYEWQQRVLNLGADNGGTLDGDTLVQVCPKKTIYQEYRLWMVDGKCITASLYREGIRVMYREADPGLDVIGFGEAMAARWSPARAFVLDICTTPDGMRILEAGCMSAAGFYAADMQKILMALEDAFNPQPASD